MNNEVVNKTLISLCMLLLFNYQIINFSAKVVNFIPMQYVLFTKTI